jgi:hypothetical protein
MPRGYKISADVQWIIVRLSSLLRKEDISIYTGISLRSVINILQYFNMHGTIEDRVPEKKKGRKQLRDLDVEACYFFFAGSMY